MILLGELPHELRRSRRSGSDMLAKHPGHRVGPDRSVRPAPVESPVVVIFLDAHLVFPNLAIQYVERPLDSDGSP